jgi:hypothetical protein
MLIDVKDGPIHARAFRKCNVFFLEETAMRACNQKYQWQKSDHSRSPSKIGGMVPVKHAGGGPIFA